MCALKSIVRWFFAVQAAILILIPLAAILGGLRSHLREYLAVSSSGQAYLGWVEAVAYGIVAAILAIGLLFAMAWWTTRKAASGNRIWAIAASLINVGQGAVLLLASQLTRGRLMFRPGDGLLSLVVGAAGLFVFTRSKGVPSETPMVRKSVAGDRTSAYTRNAVTALSSIAQIAAVLLWSRWAHLHNLLQTYGLVWVVLVTVASVLATIIHECGHALIAWCFEMSLLSFKAGPLQWRKLEGKWIFKLHLGGLLTTGGAVGAVSNDANQPRWEEILMIVAGPLANALIGVPAIYAVLHDEWPHYQQTWELAAFTASFCVVAAVLNLFPFMSEEGGYSDGARILQIVTKSPLEVYHRTMAAIASTSTSERRYRDLDVTAIKHAADMFPDDFRGLHLNLRASHCYEDRSEFTEAAASLASAEAIYNGFAIELPAPLHTIFVIGHAFLNRDAVAARLWWDRMETKKIERKNVDYWLAKTGLLWIEGDSKSAEEAWHEADILAQGLPKFGAYEFDRYRCLLLRQAMNEQGNLCDSAADQVNLGAGARAATRDDAEAPSPILPAWISASAAVADVASAPLRAANVTARVTTPAIPAELPVDRTEAIADEGGLFVRLASLTARPAAASRQVADSSAELLARIARVAASGTVTAHADAEQDQAARFIPAMLRAEEDEEPKPTEADPFARIWPLERSLPDSASAVAWTTAASSSMRSAAPSAPQIAGSAVITPLSVENWTSLPVPSGALASFSPAPVQPPSRGPSVPAAFARRPRATGPMPDNRFIFSGAADAASVEVKSPDAVPTDEMPATTVSAQGAGVAVQPLAASPLRVVDSVPSTSAALAASEVASTAVGAAVPAAPLSAVDETPKFDALAFIRAAAMENLPTR